jgi:hypothetical protein
VSDRLRVYAGNSHFLESRDAATHVELLAPLLERGVSMAKMRIGADWRTAMRVLADLRQSLPDIDLMVDGSERAVSGSACTTAAGNIALQ